MSEGADIKPKRGLTRQLYSWMMRNAQGRHAWGMLAAISFAESSFFPIPPDVMLVPMMLADRKRAFLLAGWCALFSVLGGIAGYAIGALLYDTLGLWLISLYGGGESVETFRDAFAQYGTWIILAKGAIPMIPYKIVTILAGFAGYNFFAFVLSSIVVRFFMRFGLLALLIYWFGAPIKNFIEKRLELTILITLATIVAGFVLVTYVL
jgi:membrane protein YqaA with SNARE-associated domain